jgi:hypothetical protein
MKSIESRPKRRVVLCAAAFSAALLLAPCVGWSTRVPDGMVSGEITSLPSSSQIEVAHQRYRIKEDSAASKKARDVAVGQRVQLILNGPASDPKSQVVAIVVQPNSQPIQSE